VALIVPLPLPEGVTVHQVWSLKTVQEELDTTLKVVAPAASVTFWLGGVTISVGAAASWVTVTVTGVRPVAVTVMVATRWIIVRFSW
jgi:hypothetical protein